MAVSTENAHGEKVVGGIFENYRDAELAFSDLIENGFSKEDIYLFFLDEPDHLKGIRRITYLNAGYSKGDIAYLEDALEDGKTLVSVSNLKPEETGKVIQILNRNGSHYDPDGTRNVRDDVVGMTAGAALGAAAGVLAGPVGVAVGAVTGGSLGAAIGVKMERSE